MPEGAPVCVCVHCLHTHAGFNTISVSDIGYGEKQTPGVAAFSFK